MVPPGATTSLAFVVLAAGFDARSLSPVSRSTSSSALARRPRRREIVRREIVVSLLGLLGTGARLEGERLLRLQHRFGQKSVPHSMQWTGSSLPRS